MALLLLLCLSAGCLHPTQPSTSTLALRFHSEPLNAPILCGKLEAGALPLSPTYAKPNPDAYPPIVRANLHSPALCLLARLDAATASGCPPSAVQSSAAKPDE